jgi:hypothetical protein
LSLSSTNSRVQYTITILPNTLTITFPFNTSADIAVYDGATLCLLGGDYTVAGGGYNALNQLQTGSITVVSDSAAGAANIQIGDVITIVRNTAPTQLTTFLSTGLLTPLMIEADDDKLTVLIQQLLLNYYNPFPVAGAIMSTTLGSQTISGTTSPIYLGWITAETGGIRTSIDSLNVVGIPTVALPLLLYVTISYPGGGYVEEHWMLRPQVVGDPNASVAGAFILPIVNPNSLIWNRVL